MHRVYEIFEVLPNGLPQRVTVISGLDSAKARLHELANHTPNECFAADARTRQIVALMNVPPSKWRVTKHIFQITYDEKLGARWAELLKSRGYSLMSVIGNEAARLVLSPVQQYDFFIVGSAAPKETRQEMVFWLKAKYPRAKILALNPPNQEILRADYNVRQNGPENWLPIISKEFANSVDSQG
jgi:hypothetical protein